MTMRKIPRSAEAEARRRSETAELVEWLLRAAALVFAGAFFGYALALATIAVIGAA